MHYSVMIKRAAGNKYHTEPFHERWEIVKKLGEGGFSKVTIGKRKNQNDQVYAGVGPNSSDEQEPLDVAIKCISKQDIQNGSESEELVAREVQTFSMVSDGFPYIAQLYEVCEDEKYVYLIMELLSGGELFEQIVQRGHFSEKDASVIASNMLTPVAHCHSKHVIHRDLKPENFVFENRSADTKLKLIDFGLASIMSSTSATFRTICGSPSYVAPEILYQRPYTNKVDTWSLGVIIYILLAGYPPFEAKDEKDLFYKIKHAAVKTEGKEWDAVSQQAKDFIHHVLQKDPRQRPSCEECLHHPWISQGHEILEEREHHLEHTMLNLKQFNAKRHWAAAVAGVTAMNRMARLAHLHHHVLREASGAESHHETPDETNHTEQVEDTKQNANSSNISHVPPDDPVKEGLETARETLKSSLNTKNDTEASNVKEQRHMPAEKEPFCPCVIF